MNTDELNEFLLDSLPDVARANPRRGVELANHLVKAAPPVCYDTRLSKFIANHQDEIMEWHRRKEANQDIRRARVRLDEIHQRAHTILDKLERELEGEL